jgi:hypothetical protein
MNFTHGERYIKDCKKLTGEANLHLDIDFKYHEERSEKSNSDIFTPSSH